MRRLPAAVLVSVGAHAAALGWIVCTGDVLALPLRARSAVAPDPAPAAPPEPIAIVLLDALDAPPPVPSGVASPAAPPLPGPARPAQPPHGAAIATGAAGAQDTGRAEPSGRPGRSRWMTMRGVELPRLGGLPSGFLDRFLENSKPAAPPPDIPGERIADELAEARRQLRHAEAIGSSRAGELRQQVVDLARQRDAEELRPSGGGTFRSDEETFTARVDPDGQAHLESKNPDTQDKIMVRMGIDPYARNKLAFLDRTRDQRAALGERHRRAALARSAELMQRNIDRLWSTATTLAERKAGLFALWDDCAEAGSDEIVAGGAAARTLVIGVIRARLRGGDAYTAEELAQLNTGRQSKAVFAPYE